MATDRPGIIQRFALAAAMIALASVLALAVRGLLGPNTGSVMLLGLVAASWFGGRYAGLIAAIYCGGFVDYFFVEPLNGFTLDLGHLVRLMVFVSIALLTSSRRTIEQTLHYREWQQSAVSRLGQEALTSIPLPQLKTRASDVVREVLGAKFTAYCEISRDGKAASYSAVSGLPDDVIGEEVDLVSDSSLAAHVIRTGTPVVISDLRRDKSYRLSERLRNYGVRSMIGVSVTQRERHFGVLGAFDTRPRVYTEDDINFLQSVANILAEATARDRAEGESRERQTWLQTTLRSIGDGVIATDEAGAISFMNPVAERLTGWPDAEARGRPLTEIFRIINETSRDTVANPVENVISSGLIVGLANHTLLLSRDGREIPISDSAAPIKRGDTTIGVVLVFGDASESKLAEKMAERRTREITSLYEFTGRVQRSRSMDEVYEAAIDSVMMLLGCDRASILLFDSSEVMRFVASRGLSERYRRAASGHSPWKYGETDARPIGISGVQGAEIDQGLRLAIKNEGIAALGFIPLIANDRLIGKLMVYFDTPHEFTEAEFEIAMTVAGQIAAGVERRRTEHQLFENEERLRLATQAGKVGAWDWDIRRNRIEWTDAIYAMHGIGKEDFNGTVESFGDLVHPDDREMLGRKIDEALAGETEFEAELRALRPDGTIAWLYTNAIVLRDEDGPYRMIGSTTDFTERREADQAAGRLAAIVNTSRDAIISKDLDGVITSWNRGAEEIFGYPAEEAIGKPVSILIPEERIDEEQTILERIRRGDRVEAFETVRQRKDGTKRHIFLSVSPVLDSQGRIIGASKIARDITQQKSVESAMREREIMQRLVEAQEAERHRIARDLHDHLGQRMTALRFKMEGVLDRCEDRALRETIEDVQRFALQIDRDIAFLSWELRPTELDQLGLDDALASFVREWSRQHGINAEFHTDKAPNADGERLPQSLETNLYRIVQEALNNVLKHAHADEVSVILQHPKDEIVLLIEDNGSGFDTAAGSGNGNKPGGFGLVGMRERAALLKGTLEIESEPGKGTTVFVRVPR